MLHRRSLEKPDGRALHLYSRREIPAGIQATAPKSEGGRGNPHLRWHPLRGEWVVYAAHRQGRTFLPPKDFSPLAVTRSPDFPTEMPAGDYEMAVFENLFPSLLRTSTARPELYVPTEPAKGSCEVVVFSKEPEGSLGTLSLDSVEMVLEIWAERTRALSEAGCQYILPFENRGVGMGVTLHHPHGQIYAYNHVPPVPKLLFDNVAKHWARTGKVLIEDMVLEERQDGRRIVRDEGAAVAFVPVCARYPYETWVAPERPVGLLSELSAAERTSLARALKGALLQLDGLWQRPMPYLLLLYQAPTDGHQHPGAHLHFQIYPPYRTKDKLKYLAGTELGGGVFINDSLPEEKAAELRAVEVKL
jgi:UDPglucose--hexose-1-phosphate uridylyltransferase